MHCFTRFTRLAFIFLSLMLLTCLVHSKLQEMPLSKKVKTLMEMNSQEAVMRFQGHHYSHYVHSTTRNYSLVLLLTTQNEKHSCSSCQRTKAEFDVAAKSYYSSSVYSNKLFFAVINYDEATTAFRQMRIERVPVIMHISPKVRPKDGTVMDISRLSIAAESIARFVAEETNIHFAVIRPPNYAGTMALLTLIMLVAGFLYIRRNNLQFLQNKQLWASIAVLFCFIMISGQMWNHIRSPPLMHRNQNGRVAYIHGSSQGQLVVETYLVMFINAMIVLGLILLIETGSQKDQRKARIMAIVGLVLVAVFFSFLLSVFRSKAHGYPYSFLFK